MYVLDNIRIDSMMVKLQGIVVILLTILFTSTAFSQNENKITFTQNISAACSDYNGTWEGTLGEVNTGTSFPIVINLHNKNNKIIGRINPTAGRFMRDRIWADCKNGNLSNIFWGRKDTCGGYSQEGFLVSKDVMILKVHYESIDSKDTDFVVLLKKKNSNYPYPLPTDPKDYNLGNIRTCH